MPDTDRCAYCRRPITSSATTGRPGRPAKYCRRSHRQRAYEARRRATRAALSADQVVVAQRDLDHLHDGLYALEAALDDVRDDLAELAPTAGPQARARAYGAALAHLRAAAEELRGLVIEPSID